MDVKTAFSNIDLNEKIFMEQPERCKDEGHAESECKLLKPHYELKQGPRQWFAKINSFFCDHRFETCSYDSFIYGKRTKCSGPRTTLYVDDLLIACTSLQRGNCLSTDLGSFRNERLCGS